MLDIKKTVENGKARFVLEGRLDTVSTDKLAEAFDECQDGLSELVIDFEGLEYISSAGLRRLLSIQKSMNEREGTLTLTNVNEIIMDIFEITGFVDVLNIE